MGRDDFTQAVKEALAKRVAYRCSSPACRGVTIGPRSDDEKTVNIGVAAHITAASKLGPRFNPLLSPAERVSASNGVWLCQNCAKLIDNDEVAYPEDLLKRWKEEAEGWARTAVEAGGVAREPCYRNSEEREISKQLEKLYEEKAAAMEVGEDMSALVEQIKVCKRRLRQGPQLVAGDFLLDGRYVLCETVGHGGFGTVWRAFDREDSLPVAVKILHGQFSEDRTRRERFERGARRMAELTHPSIARVLGQPSIDGGYCFFVMEYLGRGDLATAIRTGQVTAEEAFLLVLDAGEGLAEAHSHGLVHRDVKPGNILLDRHGRPKLTDFDLVRAPDSTGGTRAQGLGTFVFAAPEALDDARQADFRSDIYSLGMTALYALLGGNLGVEAKLDLDGVLDSLGLSRPLVEALRSALATQRTHRPVSVAALCTRLRECWLPCRALAQQEARTPSRSASQLDLFAACPDPPSLSHLAPIGAGDPDPALETTPLKESVAWTSQRAEEFTSWVRSGGLTPRQTEALLFVVGEHSANEINSGLIYALAQRMRVTHLTASRHFYAACRGMGLVGIRDVRAIRAGRGSPWH